MNVPTLSLGPVQVLGLAALGVLMGRFLKRVLPILDRWNVPASVVGGLVYSALVLALRDRVLNLQLDMVLRDVLMVAFFTTVGMSASLRLLIVGGRLVTIFLLAATGGLVLQIVWGVTAAHLLGLPPLLGVIPGAVSLTGGPATSLAFGPTLEKVGVEGATAVGLASAVFGIVVSGLLGGFVGGVLIKRRGLTPKPVDPGVAPEELDPGRVGSTMDNVLALALAMAAGTLISKGLERMGWTLPAYVGAMIAAGILRNLDDRFDFAGIVQTTMDEIGGIALELFIVMALLTLKLWELTHLAGPVLVILLGQVVLTVSLCWFLVFPLMGRDHPAAVMAGGYCGFMLGTTANAMASMGEIVRKSGPAPQAFFVVSIVGAFLIDFINALLITETINLLR